MSETAANHQNMSWKRSLSAKSYVRNGLVAMWDGIENLGYGVHDAQSAVWSDLAGGVGDMMFFESGDGSRKASLEPMVNDGKYYCADGFRFASAPDSNKILPALFQQDFTLEIYRKYKEPVPYEQISLLTYTPQQSLGDYYSILYAIFGRNCSIAGQERRVSTLTSGGTSSIAQYEDSTCLYFDSERVSESAADVIQYSYSERGDNYGNGTMSFKVFCNWVGDTGAQSIAQIGCIRIYDRLLSQPEIAANWEIDKERFQS